MTDLMKRAMMESVCDVLVETAKEMDPKDFFGFMASITGNVVGNMPEKYWKEFHARATEPCALPGCNCHIIGEDLRKAFKALRDDHKNVMKHRKKTQNN